MIQRKIYIKKVLTYIMLKLLLCKILYSLFIKQFRYDRIKDIHKGEQLCLNNCTYEGLNYAVNKVICNCKYKHREESNSNYINNKIQHWYHTI